MTENEYFGNSIIVRNVLKIEIDREAGEFNEHHCWIRKKDGDISFFDIKGLDYSDDVNVIKMLINMMMYFDFSHNKEEVNCYRDEEGYLQCYIRKEEKPLTLEDFIKEFGGEK